MVGYICIVKEYDMKRLDVEFLVSDDSVNCYGYRLLSSGFEREMYEPRIGYLMHERDKGVAVRWEELKVEDSEIYAVPVVNDVRFPRLIDEISEGFYVGASVGHIVALEWSDAPEMKLPGQTGPTVTRWYCREISIVDIPGNHHALAKLYDAEDNVLMDLSANLLSKEDNMNEKRMSVADLAMLGLAADATPAQVGEALRDLVARCEAAEERCREMERAREEERVEAIVAEALAAGKLYPAMAEHLKRHYAGRADALAELVATMPVQTSVESLTSEECVPAELAKKGYDELFVSGELERVKKNYPKYYEQLEKEQAKKR